MFFFSLNPIFIHQKLSNILLKKAAYLVDTVKRKNNSFEVENEPDDLICESRATTTPKPRSLMPPKQTILSLQRLQMKNDEEEKSKNMKALPWRPNSSKPDYIPVALDTITANTSNNNNSKRHQSSSNIRTENFYVGNGTVKGASLYHTSSSSSTTSKTTPILRKSISVTSITEKEECITTKDWLKRYSLNKLKLDLHRLVAGPECKHDTIVSKDKTTSVRHCASFPSINLNGVIRHLNLRPGELIEYEKQCEQALKRYVKRLQWLLSSSRRLIGTIVHKRIAILIDTSGSMDDYMYELKKELTTLVWEQLFKQRVHFNFITFSNDVQKWRDRIVEANEENCHSCISWLSTLIAHGNTCTLEALKEAFSDETIDAIYLITDGKPDTSTNLVLSEVRKMNVDRKLSVNVVSFNCEEKAANDFLIQLAQENNGRFHRSSKTDYNVHLYAHKILTEGVQNNYLSHIPDFEGDDLKRLAKEIAKAKQFLKEAITFRKMYENKNEMEDDVTISNIHLKKVKDAHIRHKNCVPSDFLA
jgi:von Willebrand factor A domain-containing protein 3